jgi:hypothetical protein
LYFEVRFAPQLHARTDMDIEVRCAFSTESYTRGCHWFQRLLALMRVTNGIPLGGYLVIPADTVNSVQTLKAVLVAVNKGLERARDEYNKRDLVVQGQCRPWQPNHPSNLQLQTDGVGGRCKRLCLSLLAPTCFYFALTEQFLVATCLCTVAGGYQRQSVVTISPFSLPY